MTLIKNESSRDKIQGGQPVNYKLKDKTDNVKYQSTKSKINLKFKYQNRSFVIWYLSFRFILDFEFCHLLLYFCL